jgi:D-lactate dehydrogenase
MLFVNISRGELSPAVDLLKALEEKILGGVALDVFNEEKALAHALRDGGPREHPEVKATLAIAEHPLGICTPHNAFNSHESVQRKSEQSVQQIEHFLKKGKLIWEAPV